MNYVILLVEDNAHIMNINRETLIEAGYQVLTAGDLRTAREILAKSPPSMIVLDIMLPDGDGISLCLELRAQGVEIPVLFLTSKGDKDDILEGLRVGGDDYLTKPYDLDILLARVQAILRRSVPPSSPRPAELVIGNIRLNLVSTRAFLDGEDLLLTPKEFALLHQLCEYKDRYISASDLYKRVWGMDASGAVSTVKERVFQIRRKLGESSALQIENVRGKGYRLIEKVTEK